MIIKQDFPGVYTVIPEPSKKSKEERIKWLDDFIEHVRKECEKFENRRRDTSEGTR